MYIHYIPVQHCIPVSTLHMLKKLLSAMCKSATWSKDYEKNMKNHE